jgi:DNA-directed RNA polymerase specialized sigma subunit
MPITSRDVSVGRTDNAVEADDALVERLATAIDALPELDHVILDLHHQEYLTVAEIGIVLDESDVRINEVLSNAAFELRSLVPINSRPAAPVSKQVATSIGPEISLGHR